MKKFVIIKTWFNTGLGDFYACLLSTKVAHDFLKKINYDVEVRINSSLNKYGLENQKKFIQNNFNMNCFDRFSIDNPIPENFVLVKNVQHAFEIYVEKGSDSFMELRDIELFGYSIENVATINGGRSQPYPPKQMTSLIHENILKKVFEITEKFGEFYSIHFRFSDGKILTELEKNNCVLKINDLINSNQNKNVFMSSSIFEINQLRNDFLKINYEINNNEDYVIRDLINMCVFSQSEKIYSYSPHWTNYLTYSLFNNKLNKKFEDFIIQNF
jgi:hypothetical protein